MRNASADVSDHFCQPVEAQPFAFAELEHGLEGLEENRAFDLLDPKVAHELGKGLFVDFAGGVVREDVLHGAAGSELQSDKAGREDLRFRWVESHGQFFAGFDAGEQNRANVKPIFLFLALDGFQLVVRETERRIGKSFQKLQPADLQL